jgi:XTP/dITP diphosphohydrolase
VPDTARVVLATRSAGKVRELRALLSAAGLGCESLEDLAIAEAPGEDGIERFDTFVENAQAKAGWFSAVLPGRRVLAEDSGLEVDALGGAPGVLSKRWAKSPASGAALDAANNRALIDALRASPERRARRARYRCVAVLTEGARRWIGEGAVEGVITTAPRGGGGFGYDPWFESEELGRTFAEVSSEEKARVSHRARAVAAVLAAYRAG